MLPMLHGDDFFKNVIPMLPGNQIVVILNFPITYVFKKILRSVA